MSLSNAKISEIVSLLLLKIGIPPNLKGFRYIREGVSLIINDGSLIENYNNGLYPRLAETFGENKCSIERNIRHAIEVSYNHEKKNKLMEVLGYEVYSYEKPTSRQLISLLVENVYLQTL